VQKLEEITTPRGNPKGEIDDTSQMKFAAMSCIVLSLPALLEDIRPRRLRHSLRGSRSSGLGRATFVQICNGSPLDVVIVQPFAKHRRIRDFAVPLFEARVP
jgi:hypothetical protein